MIDKIAGNHQEVRTEVYDTGAYVLPDSNVERAAKMDIRDMRNLWQRLRPHFFRRLSGANDDVYTFKSCKGPS